MEPVGDGTGRGDLHGQVAAVRHLPDCGRLCISQGRRPGLGERRTRPRQRFQGTDRQVRGLVLAALRELPAGATLPREDADKLWKDQIQLAACIASLDDDGLIEILDGGLRLPS